MKKILIVLLALSITALVGCSRGQSINGSSMKTAYRSIKGLKKYMPAEKQMEFEIAFGMLQEANKEDSDFLDVVDGKKPQEVIDLAKNLFDERKKQGASEYAQYNSWEQMIANFSKERTVQDKKHRNSEEGRPNDPVLYNPRFPNKQR